MPLNITHTFVSAKPDGNDNTLIRPSNWNATHTIGGNIIETDLTMADNTNNDTSAARHGFAPKLPNDATKYLNGTGQWVVPVGTVLNGPPPVGPATAPVIYRDGSGIWVALENGGWGRILFDSITPP